jgi:hypothetical protein
MNGDFPADPCTIFLKIVLGAVLLFYFCSRSPAIKKSLLKLTGSQKLLNVAMITCCAAVAVHGATHNAWETSFDSISSYVGMAPPTVKFNNVAFLDEFAMAFATFLFWLWQLGFIEVPFDVVMIAYALFGSLIAYIRSIRK